MTTSWRFRSLVPPDGEESLDRFERRSGHTFVSRELLLTALTHASAGAGNNERLEFLGDAVLDLAIAAELYARFPQLREGQLHRLRVSLVRGETLAEIGRELDIGSVLRLGAGEAGSGGRERDSNLADAVEALLGAILLDAGSETALAVAGSWYAERLARLEPGASLKDAKTELQELLQASRHPLPRYELVESPPPTGGNFRVRCHAHGLPSPTDGAGRTRRVAEQQAAAAALRQLKSDGGRSA